VWQIVRSGSSGERARRSRRRAASSQIADLCDPKQDEFDFVDDYSSQITVGLLFTTMGLPERDHADIRRVVADLLGSPRAGGPKGSSPTPAERSRPKHRTPPEPAHGQAMEHLGTQCGLLFHRWSTSVEAVSLVVPVPVYV
jgi:cytochrome P450